MPSIYKNNKIADSSAPTLVNTNISTRSSLLSSTWPNFFNTLLPISFPKGSRQISHAPEETDSSITGSETSKSPSSIRSIALSLDIFSRWLMQAVSPRQNLEDKEALEEFILNPYETNEHSFKQLKFSKREYRSRAKHEKRDFLYIRNFLSFYNHAILAIFDEISFNNAEDQDLYIKNKAVIQNIRRLLEKIANKPRPKPYTIDLSPQDLKASFVARQNYRNEVNNYYSYLKLSIDKFIFEVKGPKSEALAILFGEFLKIHSFVHVTNTAGQIIEGPLDMMETKPPFMSMPERRNALKQRVKLIAEHLAGYHKNLSKESFSFREMITEIIPILALSQKIATEEKLEKIEIKMHLNSLYHRIELEGLKCLKDFMQKNDLPYHQDTIFYLLMKKIPTIIISLLGYLHYQKSSYTSHIQLPELEFGEQIIRQSFCVEYLISRQKNIISFLNNLTKQERISFLKRIEEQIIRIENEPFLSAGEMISSLEIEEKMFLKEKQPSFSISSEEISTLSSSNSTKLDINHELLGSESNHSLKYVGSLFGSSQSHSDGSHSHDSLLTSSIKISINHTN